MTAGPVRLSWVEVDLDAVAANFDALRAATGVPVFAVVKADAYGHGALAVARTLERRPGLGGLVVARIAEGETLRAAAVAEGVPVLVLTPGLAAGGAAERWERLKHARLTPYLSSLPDVEALAAQASTQPAAEPWPVHLEVDTGMSRAGLAAAELPPALAALGAAPGLALAGLATHFAESEAEDCSFTELQLRRFAAAADLLPRERGRVMLHAANSVAALDVPAARLSAVRAGGALYGLDLAAPRAPSPRLRPAMRVLARVVQVRALAAGSAVGYGRRFVAARDTRVALVAVGYADGYPSALEGRGVALVGGRRCPVVGAISMDLVTVEVGSSPCAAGDPVVLLGEQGDESISAAELAAATGDVPYEVTCRFSRRLARVELSCGEDARATRAPAPRR